MTEFKSSSLLFKREYFWRESSSWEPSEISFLPQKMNTSWLRRRLAEWARRFFRRAFLECGSIFTIVAHWVSLLAGQSDPLSQYWQKNQWKERILLIPSRVTFSSTNQKKRTPDHKRNSSHTKMSQIRGLRFIQKRFNSQKSWELEGTKHQRYHWGYAPFSYYVQWNGPTVSFQNQALKYFIDA